MRQLLYVMLILLTAINTRAQSDTFTTAKGLLVVNPVYHGSLWMKWNTLTIAVDPYGGAERYAAMGKPDIVLITDIHGDHMDSSTLVNLDLSKATLVVPQAVQEKLVKILPAGTKMEWLANGGTKTLQGIHISALPMYNLPDTPGIRHPKGRGNGYILEMGGKKVYISGDTEDIPEMRTLKGIDIAFVCMNQPYTMDIKQAASAVLEFKPAIVYPFHYRGQGGFSDVEEFARLVKAGSQPIDVRLRKWY